MNELWGAVAADLLPAKSDCILVDLSGDARRDSLDWRLAVGILMIIVTE